MSAGVWRLSASRGVALDRALVMAILNVTPDSFSDGGELADDAAVVERARRAVAEGADILDVGGESTRPGAARVGEEEQIARVVPAVRAIREAGIDAPITVDTTRAVVALAAIDAGADGVNDQSAGIEDGAMLEGAASRGAGIVLMHRLAPSDRDSRSDRYASAPVYEGGVVRAVRAFLASRIAAAHRAGIAAEAIAVDPGLGFGKTVEQNYALMARMRELASLGTPVVCGASRKSFIGAASGVAEAGQRTSGSVAAAVAMRLGGGAIFRVHDVRAHAEALRVADAARSASPAGGDGGEGL